MNAYQLAQMKQQRMARHIAMLQEAGQQERAQRIASQNYALQAVKFTHQVENDQFNQDAKNKELELKKNSDTRAQNKDKREEDLHPYIIERTKKQTANIGAVHPSYQIVPGVNPDTGEEEYQMVDRSTGTVTPAQTTIRPKTTGKPSVLAMRKQWWEETHDGMGEPIKDAPSFEEWKGKNFSEKAGTAPARKQADSGKINLNAGAGNDSNVPDGAVYIGKHKANGKPIYKLPTGKLWTP